MRLDLGENSNENVIYNIYLNVYTVGSAIGRQCLAKYQQGPGTNA
jgi:hypothetical protein